MQNIKHKIIAIIAGLDNGSHSASQLADADEALYELFSENTRDDESKLAALEAENAELLARVAELETLAGEMLKKINAFSAMHDDHDYYVLANIKGSDLVRWRKIAGGKHE